MNNHLQIMVSGVVVALLIVGYGTFRCRSSGFQDPITKCLVKNKELCNFLDGWGILHFLYFMMLGFLYPKNLPTIFWMGVFWELLESCSKDHPFYLMKCKYEISTDKETGWWYGRWQDIVMNTLGMFFGCFLYHYFRTKTKHVSRKKTSKKTSKKKLHRSVN